MTIQPKLNASDFADTPEGLLPAVAGTTIKDMLEMVQMTSTRDESITPMGINQTRRNFPNLVGIDPIDTNIPFYACPAELDEWLQENTMFFVEDISPSLVPRGLILDGPAGVGKTMAAKYIANTFGVPLYRLDLAAVLGKFVGQSEASLAAALNQIDNVSPSIILADGGVL